MLYRHEQLAKEETLGGLQPINASKRSEDFLISASGSGARIFTREKIPGLIFRKPQISCFEFQVPGRGCEDERLVPDMNNSARKGGHI